MSESRDLAVMPVMDISQAGERRQAIVDFTANLMVKGKDYGVIPGTGNKPTLFKAGAEKLTTFFDLSPTFDMVNNVEDWTGNDHNNEPFFNYHYRCSLYRGGLLVGQGLGSCNSWEKKYRYRTVYKNKATPEDVANGRLETRQGRNGSYDVYVVTNPNPADIVNTIDKMAQKRALVAATLIAINASEFFTQDIEDMDFGHIIDGEVIDTSVTTKGNDSKQNGRSKAEKPFVIDNWYTYCTKHIPRYSHKKAIQGAVKKLGHTLPKTREEGYALFDELKNYASLRESGMDGDAAVDAINQQLFGDDAKGAYGE